VHVAEPLLDYVQKLVAATRARADIQLGLSPRAAQGLVRAARAWALLEGRAAVLPDDVQMVWPAVAGHRLEQRSNGVQPLASGEMLRAILEAVPVPR
jgi:MoxR-like ATPase